MTDPYEDLAIAIVVQAVKDWRDAVKELKKWPRDGDSRAVKRECEEFFLSDWFGRLTGMDGVYFLRKLKEEAYNNDG